MKRIQNWVIILLFLGVIFGFAGATLLQVDKDFSETENRALAQMPEVTLEGLLNGDFEKDYEKYLSDQFTGRDSWIGLKTSVERASGKQEVNGVYFAEDGYLIETHRGVFETEQAAGNIRLLTEFLEKYQGSFPGSHLSVLVVPNAVEILDHMLPLYAPDSGEGAYLEKARAAVPAEAWFDAGEILKKHPGEQLYYRTDHHWTTLGAFYVYEAWAKSRGFTPLSLSDHTRETLTAEFQGTIQAKVGVETEKDTIERFLPQESPSYTLHINQGQETRSDLYDMEKLDTRDKYAVFFGGNQAVVQADVENQSGRRLLVIKDSYANCFLPFTFHDFDEVDFIDIRYFNQSLEEFITAGEYTDLMFLYNASGFAEDTSLKKLLN